MNDDPVNHNRTLWEEWTRLHLDTPSDYQAEIASFKAGNCTLDPLDMVEVGDVSGKALLHLMCHLGLDSLSWARQGAKVTGVDFSDGSIRFARALGESCGIPATFICSDIYQLPPELESQFDVIYTEGGVMVWLPDIRGWANAAARCLKPGGVFYIRDGHPFRRVAFPVVLDAYGQPAYYHYFSSEPIRIAMRGSYAQPNSDTIHTALFWVHGIGEIVTALCEAGFRIEFLHEFPKTYPDYPITMRTTEGQFSQVTLPEWTIPSQFSIRARLV